MYYPLKKKTIKLETLPEKKKKNSHFKGQTDKQTQSIFHTLIRMLCLKHINQVMSLPCQNLLTTL